MLPIGQKVVFGIAADDLCQPLAEFPIEKAQNFAHFLQRKPLAAEFANYGQFGQLTPGVEASMAFPSRFHHAALIPPLKLARSDTG